MPSTYTLNNGIELIATGEQSGTWGDTTNTNFELLDTSLDGQVTVTLASTGSSGSPNTLPVSDGAASNGRNRLVIFDDSSDLGGTAFVQLTPSDAEKIIYVRNSLSGSRSILLFQGTYNASNDYEVPAGTTAVVFFNGAGAGAVAANVFNNAHFDSLNVVGGGAFGGAVTVSTGDSGATAASNADDLVVEASGDGGISILNPATNTGTLFFGDPSGGNMGQIKYSHTDDSMSIVTAQNTALVIDSNRRVLIGHGQNVGNGSDFQVTGSDFAASSISVARYSNNSSSTHFVGYKSRSGTVGTAGTVLADDDNVLILRGYGDDGTDILSTVADIYFQVDGTPGSNDMPGRIVFSTTADGASTSTERMRIDAEGKVGIGTTDPSTPRRLDVVGSSSNGYSTTASINDNVVARFRNGSDSSTAKRFGGISLESGNAQFAINTIQTGTYGGELAIKTRTGASSYSEAMRIDSSRRVLLGKASTTAVGSSASATLQISHNKTVLNAVFDAYNNNAGGATIAFGSSRSTTVGTPGTIVQNNDNIGAIRFAADDGTDLQTQAALIIADVDGTPGANDMPGRLEFHTTADGASSATERMRIDSAGNVGIGTQTPQKRFVVNSGDNREMHFFESTDIMTMRATADSGSYTLRPMGLEGNTILFKTATTAAVSGVERGRFDIDGEFLVGTNTVDSNFSGEGIVQVAGENTAPLMTVTRYQANSSGAYVRIGKSRGTSPNTRGILSNGDDIGYLQWVADDGQDVNSGAAQITASIDGTPGANDLPGRLMFFTTADGSSSATERMRINNSGDVKIGSGDPSERLHVDGEVRIEGQLGANLYVRDEPRSISPAYGSSTGIKMQVSDRNGNASWAGVIARGSNAFQQGNSLYFITQNSTGSEPDFTNGNIPSDVQMTIDRSGLVLIGRTTAINMGSNADTGLQIQQNGQLDAYRNSNPALHVGRQGNNGPVVKFAAQGTSDVGSIDVTTSSTSYTTSSDYRLKENVVDLTGATARLNQLAPKRFNFIVDDTTTVDGFLAHEVSDIVPEAIRGTKDEVDADGNPVYQGIDQSKLVPLLVATIKELEARITALETS